MATRRCAGVHDGAPIDVAPAEVFLRQHGKDEPAGPRWLCDVIRYVDAVDEQLSQIDWDWGEDITHRRYSATSNSFVFKADLPHDLPLFRLCKQPRIIACNTALRTALMSAELSGINLQRL